MTAETIAKPRYSEDTIEITRINDNSCEYYDLVNFAFVKILDVQHSRGGLLATFAMEYPAGRPIISNHIMSLNSRTARKKLAEETIGACNSSIAIEWDDMLEYCIDDIIRWVQRPPELMNIDKEPENKAITYLPTPILPLNQPTTIFAQGGAGKSLIADYIAVLLTHAIASPDGLFIPEKGETPVLYLDWESDEETHRRYISAIERGCELLPEHKTIHYINCTKPLRQYVEYIKELKAQYNIGLVIIDSQMAATADNTHGMTEAQIAGEYYNHLREFGTTLTIDHVTKSDMANGNNTGSPYGSVVKYNRARSQYELKFTDDVYEDADHKEYALVHTKHNLTRKQKTLGLAIDFVNEGDILVSVTFRRCNIADNPELAKKSLTKLQRIINHLRNVGEDNIKGIAEAIEEPDDTRNIGVLLANKTPKIFIRVSEGIYGLKADVI